MDVSSEMVHGLLPIFLVSALGASYTTVGFIEGIGEATAVALKVLSGPLSDWLGKRKPLVLLGYGMGALSKPLFAMATVPGLVLGARIFDRTGKGIRGAPRDALIADVVTPEARGAAFGLRQSLDTIGAVVGPILAIAIMWYSQNNYRLVFWLAVIPGLICLALILGGVREPEVKAGDRQKRFSLRGLSHFKRSFWVVAFAGGVSQLARFSEAFLILRAQSLGLALSLAPLVLIAMNVVYSLFAYPIGWISDRWPRARLIGIGFIVLALADVVLAFGTSLISAFAGIVLWGLHLGFTQGLLSALVADTSAPEFRGTAYGVFNLFSAVALLIASALAGWLWDDFGPAVTFLTGGVLACVGAVFLVTAQRILKV